MNQRDQNQAMCLGNQLIGERGPWKPTASPVELTAVELHKAVIARRDKLRMQLSHVDAWRAELELLEGMLRGYEELGT